MVLPHVFCRFRSSGPVAGLSLALMREIVARHGETVTIEAGEDGGTRAGVRLRLDAQGDPRRPL